MKFQVSDEAIRTFKGEWGVKEGQYVRIYAKYAGGEKDSYSVGINVSADPIEPAIVETIGSIRFFVERSDQWILQDIVLLIDCNQEGIYFRAERTEAV